VGIEQVQGVHNGRLTVEKFRRNRITKDSESSARWALSGCIGAQKEDRTVERSGIRYSARWALSKCADRHRRRELFEFWNLEEESTKGIFTGLLNTLQTQQEVA
jgi:hypothetical protein